MQPDFKSEPGLSQHQGQRHDFSESFDISELVLNKGSSKFPAEVNEYTVVLQWVKPLHSSATAFLTP